MEITKAGAPCLLNPPAEVNDTWLAERQAKVWPGCAASPANWAGMGAAVYRAYLKGNLDEIRRYCETDVMNTYLLYCRFQKTSAGLLEDECQQEIALVKATLCQLAPL